MMIIQAKIFHGRMLFLELVSVLFVAHALGLYR